MPVMGFKKKKRVGRRKPLKGRSWNAPDFSWMRDPELPECSNTITYTPPKKTLIDSSLQEKKSVRMEMERHMGSTAPLYNKGGYQYVTKGDDASAIGRKK